MMKRLIVILMLLLPVGSFTLVKRAVPQGEEIAGTFFGEPVSKGNYYFVLKIVLSFDSPWGSAPNNRERLEERVWDDLLLSYESHRRQISVSKGELEEKIGKTLKSDNVPFNWKSDQDAYAQWIQERFGESVEMFENQMRHLVQLGKLHAQILGSINPAVSEEEAFQEFLNEQNSLSVELAEFDTLGDAQEFYKKAAKDSGWWEKKAKEDRKWPKEDRSFRRPGFVTLEFLMDVWKFPEKAVYDMISMDIGSIYPPEPIYERYGVFKILDIRRADESKFPESMTYYFDQLRTRKKYQGFKAWLSGLMEDADLRVFIEPPAGVFH